MVTAFLRLVSKNDEWSPPISGLHFSNLDRAEASMVEDPFTED